MKQVRSFAQLTATPNPALNRTRNGMPRLAVISFSASRVTPLRAG